MKKLSETKIIWKDLAYKTDIHNILENKQVKKFTSTLKDESELYPYKVLASAIIFEAGKNQEPANFLKKVKLFNQNKITLKQLLER